MLGSLVMAALLTACERSQPTVASGQNGLSGAALARRISLDLRGVEPDPDELAEAAADDDAVDALTATWLEDPRVADRAAWIWDDTLHTALWFDDYQRFGSLEEADWRAMGQEPLRLIAAITAEDRPFSDLVTATSLPADETLASWWGLSRTDGEGWTEATPTDGRPMAGILSSTSLWNRYNADLTNRDRLRANTVARALLCSDFFDKNIQFDFSLAEGSLDNVEDAVRSEPSCLACHAALDPLAAFFGGYAERSQEEPLEQFRAWSPYTADWYAAWTSPAYDGHPGADLRDLGAMIAEDPRFWSCAASRFYEGLVGSPLTEASARAELGETFRADPSVRDLLAEILASDAYRAEDDRVLTNEQLGLALSTALGLDEEGPLAPITWDADSRVLAGGTDDDTVLQRSRVPGLGTQALLMWAARTAVPEALTTDAARDPADRLLYTEVDPEDPAPTEAAVRAQLSAWYARVLGQVEDPDGEAIDALYGLWSDAKAATDAQQAWVEALSVLVRHPALVVY